MGSLPTESWKTAADRITPSIYSPSFCYETVHIFHSTTTLNHLRKPPRLGVRVFATIRGTGRWAHVRSPALRFVSLTCHRRVFERIVDNLSDALDLSRTIGADAGQSHMSKEVVVEPLEKSNSRWTIQLVMKVSCSHTKNQLTRELSVPGSIAIAFFTLTHSILQYRDPFPLDWYPHATAHRRTRRVF